METLACRGRPWPDLPGPILENILERLPLSGYARFSAVCRRWRSVQTARRRRHSPSPPPMLRLPWLIGSGPRSEEALSCYSPFEDRSFSFPRPFSPLFYGSYDHGWLLSGESGDLVLWNPVSGDKIELPQLIHWRDGPHFSDSVVAISPPPHYLVSIARYRTVFLLRWFDSDWVELELSEAAAWRALARTVSISGKHHHTFSALELYRDVGSHDLLVVDALATPPTFEFFAMAGWRRMAVNTLHGTDTSHLVECGEETLLVNGILECGKTLRRILVGFEVYRADLDRKMWVKVESVGDNCVIMIHRVRSVSLLAADIGARGNCIYFATEENSGQGQWKVFDLGTSRVTDLRLPYASQFQNFAQLLFVPALC